MDRWETTVNVFLGVLLLAIFAVPVISAVVIFFYAIDFPEVAVGNVPARPSSLSGLTSCFTALSPYGLCGAGLPASVAALEQCLSIFRNRADDDVAGVSPFMDQRRRMVRLALVAGCLHAECLGLVSTRVPAWAGSSSA